MALVLALDHEVADVALGVLAHPDARVAAGVGAHLHAVDGVFDNIEIDSSLKVHRFRPD